MASDFPAFFYGPNGEARIFECAKDIPAGWCDSPARFSDKPAPKPRKKGR